MPGKNISMFDIINGISTGEIIEEYPKAYPYTACLIVGSKSGIFITAYWPSFDKWKCNAINAFTIWLPRRQRPIVK